MATPIKSFFPPIEKKPFLLNKQKKREPSPDVVYRQFFCLPTALAMEWGITDERKADRLFLSVMLLEIKSPTNNESQTDGIFPSVKLWNLVIWFQFDYLRKISLEMLSMEIRSQNAMPTAPMDPASNNAAKHWISKHLTFCFVCRIVIKLFCILLQHIAMCMACFNQKVE